MRINLIDQLASKGSTFTFKKAQKILSSDYSVTKYYCIRVGKKNVYRDS